MDELVESIRENGILSPVVIRPLDDGYELISGHRRTHAAKRAGLTSVPAVIRNLSDDEATVLMVDANIQREEILSSEMALIYFTKKSETVKINKIGVIGSITKPVLSVGVSAMMMQVMSMLQQTVMPKGMIIGMACGAGVSLILYIIFGIAPVLQPGTFRTVLGIVLFSWQ